MVRRTLRSEHGLLWDALGKPWFVGRSTAEKTCIQIQHKIHKNMSKQSFFDLFCMCVWLSHLFLYFLRQVILLIGGLEHLDYFSIQLGISSSQLTNSIIFQMGRYTTNQWIGFHGKIYTGNHRFSDFPIQSGAFRFQFSRLNQSIEPTSC